MTLMRLCYYYDYAHISPVQMRNRVMLRYY